MTNLPVPVTLRISLSV